MYVCVYIICTCVDIYIYVICVYTYIYMCTSYYCILYTYIYIYIYAPPLGLGGLPYIYVYIYIHNKKCGPQKGSTEDCNKHFTLFCHSQTLNPKALAPSTLTQRPQAQDHQRRTRNSKGFGTPVETIISAKY